MRLGVMRDRLAQSLAAADRSYVYGANLGWDAAEALRALGERGRNFHDLGSLVEAVVADARAGDHVVVMSNGGFGGVHGKLLSALGARAAA
jgi:UDP-N-acetylmuramate: L-alanyl-gamma-D-glutamyl-meso-diaminopimelate ligase